MVARSQEPEAGSIAAGALVQVRLQRPGADPGQAVGFLRDGTVEDAAENVGREVDVQVTSALQTNTARMIFSKHAKVKE